MPVDSLTDERAGAYGRFGDAPSEAELARFFLLDDKTRGLIDSNRRAHTRLGFAGQLTTMLSLGTFLTDATEVPTDVVAFPAEQLDIADSSCLKSYRGRDMTRLGHAWEIRDACGVRDFAAVHDELTHWPDDRAWTTGNVPIPCSKARWRGCGSGRCCCPR